MVTGTLPIAVGSQFKLARFSADLDAAPAWKAPRQVSDCDPSGLAPHCSGAHDLAPGPLAQFPQ